MRLAPWAYFIVLVIAGIVGLVRGRVLVWSLVALLVLHGDLVIRWLVPASSARRPSTVHPATVRAASRGPGDTSTLVEEVAEAEAAREAAAGGSAEFMDLVTTASFWAGTLRLLVVFVCISLESFYPITFAGISPVPHTPGGAAFASIGVSGISYFAALAANLPLCLSHGGLCLIWATTGWFIVAVVLSQVVFGNAGDGGSAAAVLSIVATLAWVFGVLLGSRFRALRLTDEDAFVALLAATPAGGSGASGGGVGGVGGGVGGGAGSGAVTPGTPGPKKKVGFSRESEEDGLPGTPDEEEATTPIGRVIHLLRPLLALKRAQGPVTEALEILYSHSDLFTLDYMALLAPEGGGPAGAGALEVAGGGAAAGGERTQRHNAEVAQWLAAALSGDARVADRAAARVARSKSGHGTSSDASPPDGTPSPSPPRAGRTVSAVSGQSGGGVTAVTRRSDGGDAAVPPDDDDDLDDSHGTSGAGGPRPAVRTKSYMRGDPKHSKSDGHMRVDRDAKMARNRSFASIPIHDPGAGALDAVPAARAARLRFAHQEGHASSSRGTASRAADDGEDSVGAKEWDAVGVTTPTVTTSDSRTHGGTTTTPPAGTAAASASAGVAAAEAGRPPALRRLDTFAVADGDAIGARLDRALEWDFDVFGLHQGTGGRPLAYMAHELFVRFHLFERFEIPPLRFLALFNTLERNYCYDPSRPNPYHCSTHAADVMQGCAHFLTNPRLLDTFVDLDVFSILLGAAVHDFRHPGVSNPFLIRTSHDLAIRYNDESVCENFHTAEAFALLRYEQSNVLGMLDPADQRAVRQLMIKVIRATDLAQGARLVNAFKIKAHRAAMGVEGEGAAEEKELLAQMVVKCADVSHPARPLEAHWRWSELITEEFFRQGDVERRLGLSISPLCDRFDFNLPRGQMGFIDFVVRPSYKPFGAFCSETMWVSQLESNYAYWSAEAAAQDAADARHEEGEGTEAEAERKAVDSLAAKLPRSFMSHHMPPAPGDSYLGPPPHTPLTIVPRESTPVIDTSRVVARFGKGDDAAVTSRRRNIVKIDESATPVETPLAET